MRNTLAIFISIAALTEIYSQQPELVLDLNEGPDPSFSEWNYAAANLAKDIILPIVSKSIGEEPAIIKNGELLILKDIYEGPEGSSPQGFLEYNGFLYFSAKDADHDFAIWRTDGTTNGTVLDYDPGEEAQSRPTAFTIGANGWLYYGYADKVFRTDGTTHEEIFSGVTLERIDSRASNNYCAYKNGIAFVNKNEDDSFSLFHIDDDKAVELAKTEDTGFFGTGFGVAPVSNGIMFSIDDSDIDAIYVFHDSDSLLTRIDVEGEFYPSARTIDLSADINIAWIRTKSVYAINGIEAKEELIFEAENMFFTQGKDVNFGQFEGKAAFVVEPGFAQSDHLVHTDGTTAGTRSLIELKPSTSPIVLYENLGYFADGVSNGFEPTIYEVDLATGALDTVHIFTTNSNKTNSIRIVGVQDGYLCYIGSLNETVGAELYRINLNGVISSNSEVERLGLTLIRNRNTLEIQMDETKELGITLYNTAGQVLFSNKQFSNQPFLLDVINGAYFLRVVSDGKIHSELISITN